MHFCKCPVQQANLLEPLCLPAVGVMELAASAGGIMATGLFAGVALGISLVEHPTRLDRPEDGRVQFKRSYPRAARVQASPQYLRNLSGLPHALASSACKYRW